MTADPTPLDDLDDGDYDPDSTAGLASQLLHEVEGELTDDQKLWMAPGWASLAVYEELRRQARVQRDEGLANTLQSLNNTLGELRELLATLNQTLRRQD